MQMILKSIAHLVHRTLISLLCSVIQIDWGKWANKWQMHFNPDKCEVMIITRRKDKTKPIYTLEGQFRSVRNTKDLGVTISSDLSWGMHAFAMVNKANMVLGIIKRSIGTNSQDASSELYKSLVRPILEYAAPVWSPYLIKDIVALEKVQRRASRLALRQKRGEMSYEQRCNLLKWQTLERRGEFLSLVQCYKLLVLSIFLSYISSSLPIVRVQELTMIINFI